MTAARKLKFNINEIQVEDGKPVDNFLSEKQMRLLTESLYSSWKYNGNFLVAGDVGIFSETIPNGIAPDVFLSLGVKPILSSMNEDKCYYLDKIGKPPEIVIEIVSNREGGELTTKLETYRSIGVLYYVVYDPSNYLKKNRALMCYKFVNDRVIDMMEAWFEELGLGLHFWEGSFEEITRSWLRWKNKSGIIPTGKEAKELTGVKLEQTEVKLEQIKKEKELETQRAELTEVKLEQIKREKELETQRAELTEVKLEQIKKEKELETQKLDSAILKMVKKNIFTIEEIAEDFGVTVEYIKGVISPT